MKVLIACEFSGMVRNAFMAMRHDAYSCDLLPTEDCRGPHLQCDVRDVLGDGWDMMIAHPPCTHLAVSGARHFHRKGKEQSEALEFVRTLLNAPIPRIALEQPYWFGCSERKATCLWLKGLPPLRPTKEVEPELVRYPNGKTYSRSHDSYTVPNRTRGHRRSITFPQLARAMAEQWGGSRLVWPEEQGELFV
jgi:hypothetical protein